jgi:predicted RNA methylase
VLVAEIIGTLLLSESQLDYIEDARNKLLVDDGVIIPASGRQFVTLISMPMLERVFEVDHYRGLVRRATAATLRVYSPLLPVQSRRDCTRHSCDVGSASF